jgi:hypothetical protein
MQVKYWPALFAEIRLYPQYWYYNLDNNFNSSFKQDVLLLGN